MRRLFRAIAKNSYHVGLPRPNRIHLTERHLFKVKRARPQKNLSFPTKNAGYVISKLQLY